MYTLPICLLVVGILCLLTHIRFFLIRYRKRIDQPLMILDYVNYGGLISSMNIIILSIVYIFIINQQL